MLSVYVHWFDLWRGFLTGRAQQSEVWSGWEWEYSWKRGNERSETVGRASLPPTPLMGLPPTMSHAHSGCHARTNIAMHCTVPCTSHAKCTTHYHTPRMLPCTTVVTTHYHELRTTTHYTLTQARHATTHYTRSCTTHYDAPLTLSCTTHYHAPLTQSCLTHATKATMHYNSTYSMPRDSQWLEEFRLSFVWSVTRLYETFDIASHQ